MKKKKRILFVANVAKEHINKFHLPSIQCFKKNGWEVDVACNLDEDIPYCDTAYNCSWNRNPFSLNTLKGIGELRKIISKNDYDVVYCHTPVGGLVARIAASDIRKNGTKVIYFAHGLHFYKGAPVLNWLVYFPIEKWLSTKTDAIFLINDQDYNLVTKRFHVKTVKKFPGIGVNFNRIKVEQPGIIREQYRKTLGIAKDDLVLIYVAELLPNKNQEYLLYALKKILETKENTKLLLVGPDHCNGEYEKLANNLGLNNNVIFTGWRNDIGELLCTADICVASSIREGFGINLVEAMYHGLPVVAVRNRGHETIIKDGENGFLVPLDDYDKMAEKVLEIYNNPNIRKKLSCIDVSKYNAESVAENIVDTIQRIG